VNTEEELYNLAKEIDARVAAVEQAAADGEALPLVLNIGANLGQVIVDGSGALISVELDQEAVAVQTGASLAGHVLRAVNNAESAASSRRKTMVDEAARQAGTR
jgi:DNA-binding protein YbaB